MNPDWDSRYSREKLWWWRRPDWWILMDLGGCHCGWWRFNLVDEYLGGSLKLPGKSIEKPISVLSKPSADGDSEGFVLSIVFFPIWRCPEIGVPPNHPLYWYFSRYKPSILGYPHGHGNPHVFASRTSGRFPRSGGELWCGILAGFRHGSPETSKFKSIKYQFRTE